MVRDNEKWKARKREWTTRNRQKITDNKKRYVARNIKYVNSIKAIPCADCGKEHSSFVMDFDHVSGNKEGVISQMARRPVGLEKLKKEIAKCEVVCSNCHRYRTNANKQVSVSMRSSNP